MFRINRNTGIAAAIVLIAAVAGIITVLSSRGEGPPRTGWMEKFTTDRAGTTYPGDMVDASGAAKSLASWRGKIVVLNFWATWCGPCIRELPSLVRLQGKFPDSKVAVIALSQDRGGWPKIAPFIASRGLKALTVYHDKGGTVFRAAHAAALPTTVLIGPDGRELGRLMAPAEWDSPEAVALIRYYLGQS